MTIALYPGSFDPIHNGHVDVVEEAAALFGEVILCAMVNPAKIDPLFDIDTRRQMLVDAVAHVPGVRIELFHGLAVDAVKQFGPAADRFEVDGRVVLIWNTDIRSRLTG